LYISSKISKSIGILNKPKYTLSCDILHILYNSLIQPYLSYCNILWGGANKITLYRLICLQKRAFRLISHSQYNSPSSPFFVRLPILKLCDIHLYQIYQYMYKAKNHLLPSSCSHHTLFTNVTHRFVFREVSLFNTMSCRTQLRSKYIGVIGPKLWNDLPFYIQSSVSLPTFKKRCVNHMLKNYGVSV